MEIRRERIIRIILSLFIIGIYTWGYTEEATSKGIWEDIPIITNEGKGTITDEVKTIILNLPKVAEEIKFWKQESEAKECFKFEINYIQEVDLDSNGKRDVIVDATYLQLPGCAGGDRSILSIIKDMETSIFADYSQYFRDIKIVENIYPDYNVLFYRSCYSHGFSNWTSNFLKLDENPKNLLELEFSSYWGGER